MAQLDSELDALRAKLAVLEERKRAETEAKLRMQAAPLKTLEEFIDGKKRDIERNRYSKSIPLVQFYDREKVAFLEPILIMLKNIQERLEVLEAKID